MKIEFSKTEIKLENNQETVEIPEEITTLDVEIPAKVILFNDDWHTFDEVITQLIKAIQCSNEQAESLAWEVHNKGKAIVFEGELSECLRVSSILEEIALHTQIEY
ncbi:MAG TPA: ATP-dependent Clp protease adaptor ClpS [Bacteroidota bacterium]|nr:ATP-dependent Clp protease adaptor ClpS [Bacteroidota bacterium]